MSLPVQKSPVWLFSVNLRSFFNLISHLSSLWSTVNWGSQLCQLLLLSWVEHMPRFIKMDKNIQIPYTNCSHALPHNFLFSFINLWQVLFSYFLHQCLKSLPSPCFSHLKCLSAFGLFQFSAIKYFVFLKYYSCYYFHLYLPQWMNSHWSHQGHVSLLCALSIAPRSSGHTEPVQGDLTARASCLE